MRQRLKHYSDELKFQCASEFITTDIGLKELKKKYGITSDASIYRWMRKFGLIQPVQEQLQLRTIMAKETGKTDKEKALEFKIEQLEKDLEYERLRTHALDTLIDIAERELKISIRKKSGTKQ